MTFDQTFSGNSQFGQIWGLSLFTLLIPNPIVHRPITISHGYMVAMNFTVRAVSSPAEAEWRKVPHSIHPFRPKMGSFRPFRLKIFQTLMGSTPKPSARGQILESHLFRSTV